MEIIEDNFVDIKTGFYIIKNQNITVETQKDIINAL